MSNKPNNTDEKEFFQKKFESFDSQPDEKVWKAIQEELNHPTRPFLVYWKNPGLLSGIAAGLFLISILGWLGKDTWTFQPQMASGNQSSATTVPTKQSDLSYRSPEKPFALRNPASSVTTSVTIQESDTQTLINPSNTSTDRLIGSSSTTKNLYIHAEVSTIGKPTRVTGLAAPIPVSSTFDSDIVSKETAFQTNTQKPLQSLSLDNKQDTPITPGTRIIRIDTKETMQIETVSQETAVTEMVQTSPDGRTKTGTGETPVRLTEFEEKSILTKEPLSKIDNEGATLQQTNAKVYLPLQSRTISVAYIPPANKTLHFPTLTKIQPISIIQPTAKKAKTTQKWSLYGSATHFMNYYAVSPVKSDLILIKSIESAPAFSSQRSSWQFQAGVSYPFTPRWSIRGGIFYTHQKQFLSYQTRNSVSEITAVTNLSPDEVQIARQETVNKEQISRIQQQIGLQLAVLYELPANPSFSHYLLGGFQSGWTQKNEYTSTLQTDVHIGYGIRRPLSPRLAFWIEPSFRYALQPIQSAAKDIHVRPYYFGISAGFTFRFQD